MRRECRFAVQDGDGRRRQAQFAVLAVQLQPPVMLGANAERQARRAFRAGVADASMPFETAVEVAQQFLRLQRAQSAVSSSILLKAAGVAAADSELPSVKHRENSSAGAAAGTARAAAASSGAGVDAAAAGTQPGGFSDTGSLGTAEA